MRNLPKSGRSLSAPRGRIDRIISNDVTRSIIHVNKEPSDAYNLRLLVLRRPLGIAASPYRARSRA